MLRLFALFLGLAILVILPFLIWGDGIEQKLGALDASGWLGDYGGWAWAVGLFLLLSDLVLPIPATAVMTAFGVLYGPWLGGFLAAGGSFLSGCVGYEICHAFGQRAALRILGNEGLKRGEALFTRFGGWLVALSRWLPVFPEVMACMAGLTRMPRAIFYMALACGSLPFGFVFAALGHAGVDRPLLTIGISALVPPVLWLFARHYFLRKGLPDA